MELEGRRLGRRGGRRGRPASWVSSVALAAASVGLACQVPPMQRVTLHLEPRDSRVWVDGVEQAPGTRHLELRSDAPHVVLAKRDGYRPEQVVLAPARSGGATRLEPGEVRIELEPLVPTERAIRIEGAD